MRPGPHRLALGAALIAVLAACGDAKGLDVSAIDATARSIDDRLHTFRCQQLDLEGFSLEGGDMHACIEGTHLRRIAAVHYGETGRVTEHLYFTDGDSVLLLRRRTERYTRPFS